MNEEQRTRFHKILDEYDTTIAAINTADEVQVDVQIYSRELIAITKAMTEKIDALIDNSRKQMQINRAIGAASKRANDQVRILLNEMSTE